MGHPQSEKYSFEQKSELDRSKSPNPLDILLSDLEAGKDSSDLRVPNPYTLSMISLSCDVFVPPQVTPRKDRRVDHLRSQSPSGNIIDHNAGQRDTSTYSSSIYSSDHSSYGVQIDDNVKRALPTGDSFNLHSLDLNSGPRNAQKNNKSNLKETSFLFHQDSDHARTSDDSLTKEHLPDINVEHSEFNGLLDDALRYSVTEHSQSCRPTELGFSAAAPILVNAKAAKVLGLDGAG